MPNMRKLLPLLILLTLVACDKSGTSSYANTSLKADPALKGIWKLVSVRFAGGNVQDMKTLYAIADSLAGNMYVQSYYEMKQEVLPDCAPMPLRMSSTDTATRCMSTT